MNKYGIENFNIEVIEEVEDVKLLDEKEIFWIHELNTYGSNGYNATKGGDGCVLYDHNELLELYLMGYSVSQICEKIKCEASIVRKVLKAHNIKSRGISKIVDLYDLAGNFIQSFDSTNEVKSWLFDHGITTNKTAHKAIAAGYSGRRSNKMYGYVWKYRELK